MKVPRRVLASVILTTALLAEKPATFVTAPRIVKKGEPRYTEQARAAGVEGIVTLKAELNENGRLTGITMSKGLGYGLDENAIECAQQWQFAPATRNEVSVFVRIMVDVNFRLPPQP